MPLETSTSKPSWMDAPEWAQYLARDNYGTWHWFEHKPRYRFNCWWQDREGRMSVASEEPVQSINTLEERP